MLTPQFSAPTPRPGLGLRRWVTVVFTKVGRRQSLPGMRITGLQTCAQFNLGQREEHVSFVIVMKLMLHFRIYMDVYLFINYTIEDSLTMITGDK